jgi:hypothetical protein
LVAAFVLLFVINNIVGLLVGSLGLIAFANRIAGRLLSAQKEIGRAHV